MSFKSFLYSFISILVFVVFMIAAFWFFRSSYFSVVDTWVKANMFIYMLVLFLYKTVGVLFPPLPAGLVTMASIPFMGWFLAYVIDLLGSLAGGTIAYHLANKYGEKVLVKVFDKNIVEKIVKMKIKKGREIESVFMFRILLGSTILEAVYYGAGLLKVPYRKFLIGAILSHMVVGIPSFLLVNNIFSSTNIYFSIALTLLALLFILITKGRYFE